MMRRVTRMNRSGHVVLELMLIQQFANVCHSYGERVIMLAFHGCLCQQAVRVRVSLAVFLPELFGKHTVAHAHSLTLKHNHIGS